MKKTWKKLTALGLASVLILGMLALTGCNEDETQEVEINGKKYTITTDAGEKKEETKKEASGADVVLQKVETTDADGTDQNRQYTWYFIVKGSMWDNNWRIGDIWGVAGKGPVTTDNATQINTAEESMYEVSDTGDGNKLVKWKTASYNMEGELHDGDEVTFGVNLVQMGDEYVEGPISPEQLTFIWGQNAEK